MIITKQRVEEIISRIEMYGNGAGYTADEVYDLAVLALNLSNISNLKRYELDTGGCDSCGQDCGADMVEDLDGEYVLWDDVLPHLYRYDEYTATPAPVSVPVALNRLRSIVADPRALPRRKELISGQQYSYVLLEEVEAIIDDACSAAMLQDSEPVTDNTSQQFESLAKSE